jgi:DNA-binding XRE family transcriptional regulator
MAKQKLKLNRLKEVLAEKGKTQVWLCQQLDLDYVTVNRWCNQKRQPSLEWLHEIAALLKCSVRDLVA